jgi:hypothetical protein
MVKPGLRLVIRAGVFAVFALVQTEKNVALVVRIGRQSHACIL